MPPLTVEEKKKYSLVPFRGLISFGIALGYIIFLYIVFGLPYYETCDDVLISSIVSGVGFVDSPNPHILYSNILIGLALTELYKLYPAFTWYGIYLISSQILAIAIILSTIQRKFTSKLSILPIFLFLLTCMRPLLLVQFTTTACLVATAASTLLLYCLEHIKLKRLCLLLSIGTILLYVWSSMIRIESAYLIMALTLVIIFLKQVQRFNYAQIKLSATTIFVSLALIFGFNILNQTYYHMDKSWSHTYSQIKSSWSLINTTRLHNKDKQTKTTLEKANWTIDDVVMLRSWYLLDPKFTNQALDDLDKKITKFNFDVSISSYGNTLLDVITDRTVAPNILVLIVFLILVNHARFSFLSALVYILTLLSIVAALILFSKFPPRVMAGILQISTIAFLLYSSPKDINRLISGKVKFAIAFSIMAIFLSPSIKNFYELTSTAKQNRIELKHFTDKLSQRKDALYVLWGAYFPYEYISPFDDLKIYFKDLKLIGFNSLLVSPIFQNRLNQFAITNFLSQLDKKNVYFAISPYTQTWLESYIEQKLKKYPKFTRVYENTPLNLSTYKISLHNLSDRPEAPSFDDTSFIIFPDNFKGQIKQLNTISIEDNNTTYTTRGLLPIVITDLKDKKLPLKDYSNIVVELKLERSSEKGRKLGFGIEFNNEDGHLFCVRLKQDDKFHRYYYNLDRLELDSKNDITKVHFYPIFESKVRKGQRITIGRIGLIRKKLDKETPGQKIPKQY